MLENSLEAFKRNIKRVSDKRTHRFRNSYDSRDYHRAYCKKYGYNISEKLFSAILRAVNTSYVEDLNNDKLVVLPCGFGRIVMQSTITKVYEDDGELCITHLIDWDKTLTLWFEDPIAKDDKILVRREKTIVRKPIYYKFARSYTNQKYYKIFFTRDVRHYLGAKAKSPKIKPLHYG